MADTGPTTVVQPAQRDGGRRPGKWLQVVGGLALALDLLGGLAILVSGLAVWWWLVALGVGVWALAFVPSRRWWTTGRGGVWLLGPAAVAALYWAAIIVADSYHAFAGS
jgi:hypothetical protein